MNYCEKIQEMISAMLDGEISERDRAVIEAHIASCPECAAMYEDFAALSGELNESFSEVPANLHSRIMKGVRVSRKPKKPLLIALRPYMSAAACLVVVIGAVFALRGSSKSMDSVARSDKVSTPAVPAAAPAEAAQEEAYDTKNAVTEFSYYAFGSPETELAEDGEPEEPIMPAEPAAPVEPFWNYEPINNYIPGMEIDEAFCITDTGSGHVPLDELRDALLDSCEDVDTEALPERASAWLGMMCGSDNYDLRLYFVGNKVIVETADVFYTAAGTPEEFLEIFS